MTLIAGIILPNGILVVSDTRATDIEGRILNEYRRKIIEVTPKTLIGTAGIGLTTSVALAKRQNLYNRSENITTNEIRKEIIEQYYDLYYHHRETNKPFGSFLVADYDGPSNTYTILLLDSDKPLPFENPFDTVLIGSSQLIRDYAKNAIQDSLKLFTTEEIYNPTFYIKFSQHVQNIFKHFSNMDHTINGKLHCEYLAVHNNQPTIIRYLLETDGSIHKIDEEQHWDILVIEG
ncbi:hypothetical protein MWG54_12705 [Bacillus cereus]|uniref:hypothetical protein n=2 Tax=Bacillus cereus group TaxID=86661 RepID=UPI001FF27993|nr:hypothetical protein [Bacillus cereus]UOX98413.1 hypothetical protein MWG54_12705 [Bacillus cereus]